MEDGVSPYKFNPANVLSILQLKQNATVQQGLIIP